VTNATRSEVSTAPKTPVASCWAGEDLSLLAVGDAVEPEVDSAIAVPDEGDGDEVSCPPIPGETPVAVPSVVD